MNILPTSERPSSRFPATRWSVVADAGEARDPDSDAALEELCRTYWMPIYSAVRHCGHPPHDAADLTQGFFARLLEKEWLQAADREKGRFRTFLMVALKRYMANEWHRGQAAKRGGGRALVPLDTVLSERLYSNAGEHTLSPDQLFDKRWAVTLIESALARMEQEYSEAGQGREFSILKPCLTAARGEIHYRELAEALSLGESAARVAVHRIRKRYRRLFRDEIARTVRDKNDVEEELRALMQALGR
jgi:RNA polymerase sigma factor (sigma-70 family)